MRPPVLPTLARSLFVVCSLPAVRTLRTVVRHDRSDGRSADGDTLSDAVSATVAESGTVFESRTAFESRTVANADAGHDESVRRHVQQSLWIAMHAAANGAVSAGSDTCHNLATDDR